METIYSAIARSICLCVHECASVDCLNPAAESMQELGHAKSWVLAKHRCGTGRSVVVPVVVVVAHRSFVPPVAVDFYDRSSSWWWYRYVRPQACRQHLSAPPSKGSNFLQFVCFKFETLAC
jgi:hypothetical protein